MGLQSFEDGLGRMVEGVFSRAFKSNVRPIEIGRRLIKEIDSNRTVDMKGRRVVPNQFVIRLAPDDQAALADIESALITELAEAVKEFNERAQKNPTGKTQPALSEDEAVAAIRGWIREQAPATDDVYKSYQVIADTKKLPEGATLTFTTMWSPFNGQEFDVWWVNLNLKTGPNTGFTFRLRDQKLRYRPLPK